MHDENENTKTSIGGERKRWTFLSTLFYYLDGLVTLIVITVQQRRKEVLVKSLSPGYLRISLKERRYNLLRVYTNQ